MGPRVVLAWEILLYENAASLTRSLSLSASLQDAHLPPRVLVNPPHHRLELLARSRLDVRRVEVEGLRRLLHALLPLDRLDELPLQERLDLLDRVKLHAGDVRDDVARRHLHRRLINHLAESLRRRLHVRRMKRARHVDELTRLAGAEPLHKLT